MLAGLIDIGVHSSKDVATRLPEGIALAAFLEREDVRDAFMSVTVQSPDHLPEGAKFGTSSIRRAAQVLRQRPILKSCPSAAMSVRGCKAARWRGGCHHAGRGGA